MMYYLLYIILYITYNIIYNIILSFFFVSDDCRAIRLPARLLASPGLDKDSTYNPRRKNIDESFLLYYIL